jgi:hypothetical protein
MKARIYLSLFAATALVALAGCKATPQMTTRPDFLTTYDHLQKVDGTTWRYISPPLLANCNKFVVSPVKVLFNEYDGKPITEEQRQHSANFVRQSIIDDISAHYTVVPYTGPDVAEIRVALTGAYATAGKLGLCVQGEIIDPSKTQVAAVVRTELSEYYSPNWEDRATARKMVDEWASRMLKAIDQAHGK